MKKVTNLAGSGGMGATSTRSTAERRVLLHFLQERAESFVRFTRAVIVFSILSWSAARGVAVPAQHVELVRDGVHRRAEQVARVGVLGHHPQGLPLAAAADEDRRPGRLQRRPGDHEAEPEPLLSRLS